MPQAVIGCALARGGIDTRSLSSGHSFQIENTTFGIESGIAGRGLLTRVAFDATNGCGAGSTAALSMRGRGYRASWR